jgi:transposase InsO family protein
MDQRLQFVSDALGDRFTMTELCEGYCYPLTIADQHTRFLLECHGLLSTETATARPVFERVLREYGLPGGIRTDNGVPFATLAVHGLSYLNTWWMRLGIVQQRIHPGAPQENGAHERMHRTLKRRAVRPVQRTCAAQQKQFDAFRLEYTTERPHDALGGEAAAEEFDREASGAKERSDGANCAAIDVSGVGDGFLHHVPSGRVRVDGLLSTCRALFTAERYAAVEAE